MKILTKGHVIMLHKHLTEETGGIADLRDEGLLDAALAAPFQSFDGSEMYPSLQQKASRLAYGLIQNHPFVDGNKRIGVHAMLTFLALNGVELEYRQKELSDIILSVASGDGGYEDILRWLLEHEVNN